jgi:hypothetical protein
MTHLVYDEISEEICGTLTNDDILGRTLTDDEYANITADELRDAIHHSDWALFNEVFETGRDWRFTPECYKKLNAMTADELKDLIQKGNGLLIRGLEPTFRTVFPPITRGPRKGYPNFRKEPEEFWDRWYSIEHKDNCVVKGSADRYVRPFEPGDAEKKMIVLISKNNERSMILMPENKELKDLAEIKLVCEERPIFTTEKMAAQEEDFLASLETHRIWLIDDVTFEHVRVLEETVFDTAH